MVSYDTNKGKIEIEKYNRHSPTEFGSKVFKNNEPAPDGKYSLGFMWFVHVENGKVAKVTLF